MESIGTLETSAAGKRLEWAIYVAVLPKEHMDMTWASLEELEPYVVPIDPEWRNDRCKLPPDLVAAVVKTRRFVGSETQTLVAPTFVLSGKNLGKKNQTNALTQALKEAEATLRKRKEKKLDDFVRPMLAKEIELEKLDTLEFPLMVQEKIDGVRVVVKTDGTLQSRGGKPLPTPAHLERDVRALAATGFVWDGELFATTPEGRAEPLQFISGAARGSDAAKKPDKETERVRARLFVCLYDAVLPGTYRARLAAMRVALPSLDHCRLIDTDEVMDAGAVRAAFDQVVSRHGEGLILRSPDSGLYLQSTNGARSPQLLKLKAEFTADALVVDVIPGKQGADRKAAVFVLKVLPETLPQRFEAQRKAAEGAVFDAVPNMTRPERERVLREREDYLGKVFAFSFQDMSEDGSPLRARALAERVD